MLRLVQVIDQAVGYVAPTAYASAGSYGDEHDHHAHHHAQQPLATPLSSMYYTSTVQEKWVDYPEEFEVHEREGWKKEGEMAMARANQESLEGIEKRV